MPCCSRATILSLSRALAPGAGRTLSFDALLAPLAGGWLTMGAPSADDALHRGESYRGATWVVLLLRLQLAVVRLLAFNRRVLLVVDVLVVVLLIVGVRGVVLPPTTLTLSLTTNYRSTSSPSCGSFTRTGSRGSAAASPSSPLRSRASRVASRGAPSISRSRPPSKYSPWAAWSIDADLEPY